ncbi:hypothetical protein [Streptococcus thermophilus]|jgi:hypothetical protein|uniref:Phage protein n=3 Tax=Streptococcus thermophilus TaxID=1308 RepID=A0A8D6U1N0_STRTR|nr:hypothetical protein [Streptococcus thermophilus]QBX11766.1 hypothetical protein JavanS607_0005 [Streptococcus satellite phage Javan607]QBX11862.1 hypothetical protein JavanS613_0005 [Streptococcus satellite phage Javan613]ABJ66060.1 Uncharacterized conserved phage related protein [Streptococcus thermophilus LMD-9]AKB97415.1 hypothetical protein SMQ301_0795 [Streptococcus thermophilus]ASX19190.1 hypothetical protein BGL51_04015 [Streptococcus thermophilus]
MSRQELLEYLLEEIEKCGFKICDIKSMPLPAVINVDARVMIYNSDEATPFEVAHELIHIINKDKHRGKYFDAINPQEVRANHEAILLLWEIFIANGGSYEYFNVFVNITDAPFELAESIIKNEYLELHEAITEIFEDEIKVSINKQEMHDYIVDYISYFDVIEDINVYQFLDRYHLSHNFFNMAEKEFQLLLGTN